MKPMRMLILLAVFWAAGSLLLAAESPQTPKSPKPAATQSAAGQAPKTEAPASDAKTADAKTSAQQAGTKDDKDQDGSKRSIAEQAEAALKAAAEADGSAAKAPPKSDDKGAAVDETQAPNPGKGPSPQRFVPSEQVRADFDVSFPIDI